jgi:hypothetical protein
VVYGGSCVSPTDCESGFCVEGICCNSICNQPGQTCETGTCALPAPAPAVSHPALLLIVVLLVAIGCFALTPLRFGKAPLGTDQRISRMGRCPSVNPCNPWFVYFGS